MIYKYPRTYHLPWSPGLQHDDKRIESLDAFEGQEVVVTEKMDGENTTMYSDYIHARSPNPLANHPSRTRIRQIHDRIRRDIPEGFRICGENMQATHSIHYQSLPGYFLVFNIWNGDTCLSWDDTVTWSELLCLPTVKVLYRGPWDSESIPRLSSAGEGENEGYVVRVARAYLFNEFTKVNAKYVRANHIQTDSHWLYQPMRENEVNGSLF